MSNIWKRSLSMFLALVMVFGMLPMPAFADGEEPAETPAVETPVEPPVEEAPAEEPAEPEEEDPPVVEEPAPEEEEEETPAPEEEEEETPAPEEEEETPAPEEEEETPVEPEKPKLSGETREIYFLNTEEWDEVYVTWTYEEEAFEAPEFPGEEMEEHKDLEDVFVYEIPVEAVAVCFNDTVEVTDELLAEEAEEGIEAIHFFEAELNEDEALNYFSADEQVKQEKEEDEVTEWLEYEDIYKAWEKAQEEVQEPEAPAETPVEEAPAEEPEIIFEEPITIQEDAPVVMAVSADTDHCYWSTDKKTLYVKANTAIDLYDAIADIATVTIKEIKYNSGTSVSTDLIGTPNGTTVNNGSSVTLTNNADYAFAIKKGRSWYGYQRGTFKVVYYYDLTAQTADGSPAGAGISVEPARVIGTNTAVITVNNVNGYTASVTDSKGNAVTNLTAYAPSESTTLTVTYTSNEVKKYGVKVVVTEATKAWGTATLKSEAELTEGAEALVEVTPKTGDAQLKYEVESVKVGDTVLSKNANGYYVYTMGAADATITVSFKATNLKKNDSIGTVKFDTSETVSAQLADLKNNIFEAVIDDDKSLSGDEKITADDVDIQYIPWYYGEVSSDYKHSYGGIMGAGAFNEVPHDLTADPTSRTAHTGYSFGERFANGETNAERVVLTGKNEWAGLKLTVDITLENTSKIEVNEDPEIEINGHNAESIMGTLKVDILDAVLKDGYEDADNYTVYVYFDIGFEVNLGALLKLPSYVNIEDSDTINKVSDYVKENLNQDFWVNPGDDLQVKIVDNLGRYVEVTVATSESRPALTVNQPAEAVVTAKYNTKADFETAISDSVTVSGATSDKEACGLKLSFAWEGNQATVTYEVTEDSDTWKKSEGELGTYSFTIQQYTVTFVDTDGTVLDTQTLDNGSTPAYAGETSLENLAAAKKTDEWTYTFAGWDKDTTDEEVSGIEALAGSNVTYTAVYTQKKNTYDYTVNTHTMGLDGEYVETSETKTGEYGPISITPATKEGFTLNKTKSTLEGNVVADESLVLEVYYDRDQYTLTVRDQDLNTPWVTQENVYFEAEIPAATVQAWEAREGHDFVAWAENETIDMAAAKVNGFKMPASDLELVGDWTIHTFTVTIKVDGKEDKVQENIPYGFLLVEENPAKEGFGFEGWDFDGDGAVDETSIIAGYQVKSDLTLTAIFSKKPIRIGTEYFDTLKEAVDAANKMETATIQLMQDITLGEKLTIAKDVTIEGNYTITRADDYTGTLFVVNSGAALTLDGGLTIDGGNNYAFDKDAYMADVENKVQILDADNAKWFTPEEGAPVATAFMMTTTGGTINLNNVTIQNNYATRFGITSAGANSTITLNGAKITHVASLSGNGVVANVSGANINVIVNEGTVIDGNHVGGNHGLFMVYSGAKVTMNGGEITNNTGWNSNGVVAGMHGSATIDGVVHGSAFIMNGGLICSNVGAYGPSNGRNAAIYLHASSVMEMHGGKICHNMGLSRGGIDSSRSSSTLIITAGEVLDNISLNNNPTPDIGGVVGTWAITGGTFTQDVNEWCADDFKAEQNEDGTWGVRHKKKLTVTISYGNGNEDEVINRVEDETVTKPETDPTYAKHIFQGWYLGENEYDFNAPVLDNITITAKWAEDMNEDGVVDGSETDPYWTIVTKNGEAVETTEKVLNGENVETPAAPEDIANAIFVEWQKEVVGHTITFTAVWNTNDANDNNVDDNAETFTAKINGEGKVTYVVAEGAKELVEKALSTADSKSYVFDSTNPIITIIATPVVTDGISSTYVESISSQGTDLELTYGENYAATATVDLSASAAPIAEENAAHPAIEVNFAEAAFQYDEDGQMRFYVGMETPKYETLYNAIITAPAYDATEGVVSAKYLARPAATYQMQVPVLFEIDIDDYLPGAGTVLGWAGLSSVIKIGGNTVDVDLDDAWLNVGEEFKTLTPDELQKQYDTEIQKIKDEIAKIDLTDISLSNVLEKVKEFGAISDELTSLIETIKNEADFLGYHQFGESGLVDENGNAQEILQIIYSNEKMHLQNNEVRVTLVDDRIATTITGGDLTFEYDEFTDEDIMNALVLTDADGNVIEGELKKVVDLVGTEVGSRTYTVSYAGSWDYKPCEVTFTLTVVKAPSKVDVADVNIKYNEGYDGEPVVTNKHGEKIDVDTIEFILGLDVAELDINGDGINGLEGKMQLILTDELQTILSMVGLKEGVELNISDLIKTLTNTGLLEQWGVTGEMVETLQGVLDSINGLVEANNLMITVGGEYPTDIGAYLHGAVTVDKNYDTAFDVGYILITPSTTEYHLKWDAEINSLITMPAFKELGQKNLLGAHAADNESFEAANVILGINDDESIYSVDIYGKINLNIWFDPNQINDNGAYVQLAYGLNWGNELAYAIPIVRSFAIVPETVKVELVGEEFVSNRELLKTFNNQPQGFSVKVSNANGVIYTDHYQHVNNLPEHAQVFVNYVGVQTNGQPYNSTNKPVHAGVYTATALYLEFTNDDYKIALDENGAIKLDQFKVEDLYELFDLVNVGMDVGLLVIEPSTSSVTVEDKFVTVNAQKDYVLKNEMVNATSTVKDLKPDTTVISAQIASDGTYSDAGWDAIQGNVNVDFPKWMDAILAEHVPSVVDGITAAQLKDKLTNKLPAISEELAKLGATNEMINSLSNLIDNINGVLENIPNNATLSFKDDVTAKNVGAYAVVAIVTDSDHYPSVDAGILVITPAVKQVYLNWNYQDQNAVWTRELLAHVDLWATAYNEKTFETADAEATEKITHQFIGIDKNGQLIVDSTKNPDELPNGAYIELAYIEFEVDGQMVFSDLIAREVLIVPGLANVKFENVDENNVRKYVFDNTAKTMPVVVDINGTVVDASNVTYNYVGVQTNGKEYVSNAAPKHAGIYFVTATYLDKTSEGSLAHGGVAVGTMIIEPAASAIDVTGGNVKYDGKGHTATVGIDYNSDYTLISGGASIEGNIDEIGVDAFHGNVNIDLPAWLDKALAEHEFKTEGIDSAYLIDFITSYRDEMIAAIPTATLKKLGVSEDAVIEKANAIINELLAVLAKVPTDVALTFEDDITYTEPGNYFYYGIVTDSDRIPSTDTGLLVIEKNDAIYDLLDTTVIWDGNGHKVNVNNPMNADALTLIIDRANKTMNIQLDSDAQYLLNTLARILNVEFDGDVSMGTITGKYNGAEVAEALVKLIAEAEKLSLPTEIAKALTAIKTELETLPAEGTIVVNGGLPSDVGTYEFYALSYSQYYNTNASKGTLTIVPAEVTITMDSLTKTYGDADPELTYKVEGLLNGDTEDALNIEVSRVEGENVGEYAITATASNKHYTIKVVDGTLTINKAKITVTMDKLTKTYGEADPNFSFTSETEYADEFMLVVEQSREAGEDVGTYEINANAYVFFNDNFVVEVIPGELTITAKKITTADVALDGTLTYNGTEQTQNITVTDGINYTVTGNTATNAGAYTMTVTVTDGNYTGSVNVDWTIAKKAATVTANNKTMVAGGTIPAFDATVEGVIDSETLNYTLSCGYISEIGKAGEFDIVVTLGENPNYDVTPAKGVLKVESCIVTVDDVPFHDWNEAKAAIKGDSTIVLYADINNDGSFSYGEQNKTLILDLNGHKFTTTTIGQSGHKTLHIMDSAENGSVHVTNYTALYTNGYLNVDSDVDFTSRVQLGYHTDAQPSTGCFMVDGEKWFGRGHFQLEDGMVGITTLGNVTITNGVLEIAFNNGNFILNDTITTLNDQKITVDSAATLTIPEGVILTLNPTTEVIVNGTVKGEGTVIVNTDAHLKEIVEKTTVENVKLGTDVAADVAANHVVNIDLNGKTLTGNITGNNTATIIDSTVDETKKNYTDAGIVTGTVDGVILMAGTYNYDVSALCAEDYIAVPDAKEPGTWTVMKGILTVDGVPYDTWEKAIPDMSDGADLVVLYKDITAKDHLYLKSGDKDLVIDLNGHTLNSDGKSIQGRGGNGLTVINGTWSKAWVVLAGAKDTVTLDPSVNFDGSIQMNNQMGTTPDTYFFIGDELVIGEGGMFKTGKEMAYVSVRLADELMSITLLNGDLVALEDITTLAGQTVTLNKGTELTVNEGVTITLDPNTTVINNGTVNGSGTIVVSKVEHLDTILDTQVATVKLAAVINGTVDAKGETTLDLARYNVSGGINVTGKLAVMDSTITAENQDAYIAAGNVIGTISGATKENLVLYAGTYIQDVSEYCAPGYVAVKNAETIDGYANTWTVMTIEASPYICWNTQTHEYFDDVTDAFDKARSGDEIEMLKDATETNKKNESVILVKTGTTFDLNGYYVEAANLLSYGVVMDSMEGKNSKIADGDLASGGILISGNTTEAWTQLQPENGGYLPIYDTNTGSYKFFEGNIKNVMVQELSANSLKFWFQLLFTEAEGYKVLGNTDEDNLGVVLKMNWTGMTSFGIEYTMYPDSVITYANDSYNYVVANGSNGYGMFLQVNGLNKIGSGGWITCEPTFASTTTVADAVDVPMRHDIP